MDNATLTRIVTVANPEGLHARAATLISATVRSYRAKVQMVKGSDRVDAIDVLQVLSLGAGRGEQLLLEATGDDAGLVLDGLVRLFVNHFQDEQPPCK